MKKSPCAIAGTEKRISVFGVEKPIPGSGAYGIVASRNRPAFKFNKGSSLENINDSTDSGPYKLTSKMAEQSSYAMPTKSKEYQCI